MWVLWFTATRIVQGGGEGVSVLKRSAESVIYRGGTMGGETRVTYRVWDPWQVVQLNPA